MLLFVVRSAAIVVLVALPLYLFFKLSSDGTPSSSSSAYEATYRDQYAWTASGAFLSGWAFAVILIALWISSKVQFVLATRVSVPANSPAESVSTFSTFPITTAQKWYIRYRLTEIALLIGNVAVVTAANAGYVYLMLFRANITEKIVLQIALSVFNIAWGVVVSRSVKYVSNIRREERAEESSYLLFFVGVFMYNLLIAPILATATVDSSCFRQLFVEADVLTSTYEYLYCSVILFGIAYSQCVGYSPIEVQTSYVTAFTYNFTCSSAVVSKFVPSLLYYFAGNLFVVCGSKVIISELTERGYDLPVVFSNMVASSDLMLMSAIDFAKLLSIMFVHAAAMLSFGIISPVLAVAIVLSAAAHVALVIYVTSTSTSRRAAQNNNRSNAATDDAEHPSTMLLRPEMMSTALSRCLSDVKSAAVLVVVVSFVFMCGYVIDSLGDDNNWKKLVLVVAIVGTAIIIAMYGLIYIISKCDEMRLSRVLFSRLRSRTRISLFGKPPDITSSHENSEMEMKPIS
jgi:hypothetical protein